jgi:hypothetical protein
VGESPIPADPSVDPAALEPVEVPDHLGGVLAALALIALVVAIDLNMGPGPQVVGLLTAPAFLAAMFAGPRKTLFVAVVATVCCAALDRNAYGDNLVPPVARLLGVVLAGAGAVWVSSLRVDRERRLVQMSHIAELAQLAVLRSVPERVGCLELGIRYISATADARIGGDFYEVQAYKGGVRLVLGDVRGKGVGAVRLASVLVGAFRAADHDHWELDDVVASMDRAFARAGPGEEDFATVIVLDASDSGDLLLVNCGHPPPLLLRASGPTPLTPPRLSPPIGLAPEPVPVYRRLGVGDRVLLYTDGLLDARSAGATFDLDRTAPQMRSGDIQHAVDRLRVDLVRFLHGRLDDDTTLVLLQLGVGDGQPADPP